MIDAVAVETGLISREAGIARAKQTMKQGISRILSLTLGTPQIGHSDPTLFWPELFSRTTYVVDLYLSK